MYYIYIYIYTHTAHNHRSPHLSELCNRIAGIGAKQPDPTPVIYIYIYIYICILCFQIGLITCKHLLDTHTHTTKLIQCNLNLSKTVLIRFLWVGSLCVAPIASGAIRSWI